MMMFASSSSPLAFFDAATPLQLGSLCQNNDSREGNLPLLGVWIALALIYHVIVFWVTDRAEGSDDDFLVEEEDSKDNNDDEHSSPFDYYSICPKRRERWYKCAKRCKKRCEKTTPTEECFFAKCAMNLIKQHLPPPLPLNHHHKNKKAKSHKTSSLASQQENTLSSCQEKTSREEKTSGTTATSPNEPANHIVAVKRRVVRSAVPLIDLARMQYWDSVIQQANRRGAKYRDADGLFPLHWACSGGPPLPVVQALLQAYPSAARKTDREGSTALHFATHYSASMPVVQAVLEACPKAVSKQDRYGRTPLYHAVEKCAGVDVLAELLAADPTAITLPCLPLDKRNTPLTRAIARRTPLYMAWSSVLLDRKTRETKRGKKWDKACLLLQAAYRDARLRKDGSAAERDFKFLPAVIALDPYLPEQIFHMAVSLYPEQLAERDELGRIPLLQAAQTNLLSRQRSDDVMAQLLQASSNTAAQSRDAHGKSALQLAIEAGKPWSAGVSRLFDANPEAIHWADHNGITPALAAATVQAYPTQASSPTSAEVHDDDNPLGLLTTKEQQLLRQRKFEFLKVSVDEGDLTCTEQLSTIFHLLSNDPSVLALGNQR